MRIRVWEIVGGYIILWRICVIVLLVESVSIALSALKLGDIVTQTQLLTLHRDIMTMVAPRTVVTPVKEL
jgi:hypothetical protein